MQVSNCLWTLDVTVLVIDMKHAEQRNGQFCCCDEEDTCAANLTDLGTCEKNVTYYLMSPFVLVLIVQIPGHALCSLIIYKMPKILKTIDSFFISQSLQRPMM